MQGGPLGWPDEPTTVPRAWVPRGSRRIARPMNQTPPLPDYDLYSTDPALREAVRREGAPGHEGALRAAGIELGTAEWREHARLANRNPPILHTHDVRGERIDRVEFHPSWHVLMRAIVARGYHCSPWSAGT